MAANRPATRAPARNQQDIHFEEWDEGQLEDALETLKEIHLKLRNLRSTIPRMVNPLTGDPSPSPELLNIKCQESLAVGIQEVKNFKASFTGEGCRKVLEHAALSRKRNIKNIKPWKPRDEPDWASI